MSQQYGQDVQQTALIVAITAALLGTTGKILLAIIVALACLTTIFLNTYRWKIKV